MNDIFNFEEELSKYGLTTETYEQLLQDCSNKTQHISDDDWTEICDRYDLDIHYDTLRKSSQFITGGSFVSEYYKWKESQNKNTKTYNDDLDIQKRELRKERIKLQSEKLEYNRWLRENARDELIVEKICDSITTLPPLEIPKKIELSHNTKGYVLTFGDEHFGTEYVLKDLFGNIINEYSPEVFEERMWLLFSKVIEIIKKENIDVLNVFSMGDFSDGILRASQLMKLRYGVVEQTIKYADFIADWLNELSKYVVIKFQMVNGNHTELRMINQPKGTFVDDNMGFVVLEFLKTRLKDNHNIKIIENPTGLIYAQICTYPVLCIHGEVKNMERALKDFSITYGVPISYLFAGHLHHSKSEDVGIDCAVYNIPSVIGVDSYSLSLNKTSNAGAKLFVFEQTQGITTEYNLKLN